MKQPGVTIRPLRQISGDDEFNEVFFDNVKVLAENVVGAVGEGWKIAISTLMYERIVLTFARMLQSEVALRQLVSEVNNNSYVSKEELAKEIAWSCAIRSLAYEQLASYSSGSRPGPEGSMIKLLWSESFQSIAKLGMKSLGKNAIYGEKSKLFGLNIHRYLYSRGRTIAAGTSEIQRNIIAERLLGLPRL
jgi:alkylation response protein AidB-like acyl-CoA dehydrogenase